MPTHLLLAVLHAREGTVPRAVEEAGVEHASIAPAAAGWNEELGEFIPDYDDVRSAEDPEAAILAFAAGTYAAGVERAGWDRALLERTRN